MIDKAARWVVEDGQLKIHRKVRFMGNEYWHHGINISPLDHYNEEGELLVTMEDALAFRAIAFAIILDDMIIRKGEIIGTVEELEQI